MTLTLKSQRGAIGSSWLATSVRERFEQALGPQGRAKGKQGARRGSVQWIDVQFGQAEAAVEPGPAHPILTIGPWHQGDVQAFASLMQHEPGILLALLDGTYGPEHEVRLERESLGLLPGANAYVSFDCSCTFSDVCPHVYALAYVLVEHIDDSPGDYLRLLGIDLDKVTPQPTGRNLGGADGVGQSEGTAKKTGELPEESDSSEASLPSDSSQRRSSPLAPASREGSRFAPAALDPTILTGMMSDDVASIFTAFYSAAPAAAPQSPEASEEAYGRHSEQEEEPTHE